MKDERDLYAVAADRLSLARDEDSYQRVLAELSPMVAAVGGSLTDHVPPSFPGPEGLREIATKALSAKERPSLFMQQANIDEDNERADRNTDSLIGDRAERRGIQRRGQDIRSGDVRRGQDIRGSGGRRSAVGRGGGRENLPVVSSPAEAMKLAPGTRFKTPDGRVKVR
jgi:hypothetical protein